MEGFLKQSTAVNVTVTMIDSSDHITGKPGLTLTIYSSKAGATPAAITPTVTEIDSTNAKGVYRLAFTTGHTDTLGELAVHVTASGADPADVKWQVSTYLPGEAATLQAGTGAGQLDFTTGVVKADLAQILGTALTETAGQIAGAFKKFFNIATPASTMDALTLVATATTVTNQIDANVLDWKSATAPAMTGDAFARLGAPAGASISADVAAVLAKSPDSAHFTNARGDKLDELDAAVSTRLATSGYTAPDNSDISAIKAKTDNLPAAPADETLIISATNAIMSRLGSPAGASVSSDIAEVKTDTAAAAATAAKLDTALELDTGNYRYTTAALAEAPSGGGGAPTVDDIVDGVLDATLSDHVTSGSVGAGIANASASGSPIDALVEGSLTLKDVQKILLAYMGGQTTATKTGANTVELKFLGVSDSREVIVAEMTANKIGGERTSVALTP